MKEEWWNNAQYKSKCEKAEDQSDGISIQNIGGVFIVIFVGIGMACVTLMFEYWWYKFRKQPKIIDVAEASSNLQKSKHTSKLGMGTTFNKQFNRDSVQKNSTLRPRNQLAAGNTRIKY